MRVDPLVSLSDIREDILTGYGPGCKDIFSGLQVPAKIKADDAKEAKEEDNQKEGCSNQVPNAFHRDNYKYERVHVVKKRHD